MSQGYFTHPTVFQNQIYFVSEEDLWITPLSGGVARRLTAGQGAVSHPIVSRDGQWLAFASEEEGHREIFILPALGGETRRLTYLGGQATPVCWTQDGRVIFHSNFQTPHREPHLFVQGLADSLPTPLRIGPAVSMDLNAAGEVILERNANPGDPARWKRYRGGRAGKVWIGESFDSEFHQILKLEGNLSRPMWVKDRIYFLSDHKGVGNLYSSDRAGEDLVRHTHHRDFYARNARTDGHSIVYHAGAEIFLHDIDSQSSSKVDISYYSQRTQKQRKYVSPWNNLERLTLHPKDCQISVTSRGQIFSMGAWQGPVTRYGSDLNTRYRNLTWLPPSGEQLIAINDAKGEDSLSTYNVGQPEPIEHFENKLFGRIISIYPSPDGRKLALSNHRHELLLLDLKSKECLLVDQRIYKDLPVSPWSPDGRYIAYAHGFYDRSPQLKIYSVAEDQSRVITKKFLEDSSPVFDPCGDHLYFVSKRVLDPVYDSVQFELSFPTSALPCLITLRKDLPNPFLSPRADTKTRDHNSEPQPIDFEGIENRILAFPVKAGNYSQIRVAGQKVFWLKTPVTGALTTTDWRTNQVTANSSLEIFDWGNHRAETLAKSLHSYSVSLDGKTLALRTAKTFRLKPIGEKSVEREGERGERSPGPHDFHSKAGWVDLYRLKILVEPAQEWRQMFKELWRLQRDQFWVEDMSKVDWPSIFAIYNPLVEKVNCRREFSDLVWEMQGELGTSHAYDIGGDYREQPKYHIGKLAAEFAFDPVRRGYRIQRLLQADAWNARECNPLQSPGLNLKVGDVLTAINGTQLTPSFSPYVALMNLTDSEVSLSFLRQGESEIKSAIVKTLTDELPVAYRDWVENNRALVTHRTEGRVGYIHIPDMSARGFAEFHRAYLQEFDKPGLIIDIRYNGGGHVSQLLLEKLARERHGFTKSRWSGVSPNPRHSPSGPMVALTDEHAGSDGDIFSHTFKMKQLGPLIGTRTWGGVIGIAPRYRLIDGSLTTQPEFSHWFSDVGWSVENYGTDPTIIIEFPPHAYRRGEDPQLDRGLTEILKILESVNSPLPNFKDFPDLRAREEEPEERGP